MITLYPNNALKDNLSIRLLFYLHIISEINHVDLFQ